MFLFDEKGKMVDVSVSDISYIERVTKSRKTLYYRGTENLYAPSTLKQLGQVYEQYGFQQIDKNRLINLDKVDRVEKGYLYIGDLGYSVSRSNEKIIRKIMDGM
jgi:DNA-binding LytR/AlgR family response regulator